MKEGNSLCANIRARELHCTEILCCKFYCYFLFLLLLFSVDDSCGFAWIFKFWVACFWWKIVSFLRISAIELINCKLQKALFRDLRKFKIKYYIVRCNPAEKNFCVQACTDT